MGHALPRAKVEEQDEVQPKEPKKKTKLDHTCKTKVFKKSDISDEDGSLRDRLDGELSACLSSLHRRGGGTPRVAWNEKEELGVRGEEGLEVRGPAPEERTLRARCQSAQGVQTVVSQGAH